MAMTETTTTTTTSDNVRIIKVVGSKAFENASAQALQDEHAQKITAAPAGSGGGGAVVVDVVGYGEGAPDHSPTAQELPADILNYIQKVAGPKMLDQDPVRLLMEDKITTDPHVDHIVAMGAIDIALWYLRRLGRVRSEADVLWPVSSANSLEDDIKDFQEKISNGYHSFMVKCGSYGEVW